MGTVGPLLWGGPSPASCAALGAVVLRSARLHSSPCFVSFAPLTWLPAAPYPSLFIPTAVSPPGASASWTPPLPVSVMPILRNLPPPRSPPELEGTGVGTRGPSWEWALGGGKPLGPRC